MTYMRPVTKPKWLNRSDLEVDISDAWASATGEDDLCIAHFGRIDVPTTNERHECGWGDGYQLIGIAITDRTGTIYRDREWAMKMLGWIAVVDLEEWETQKAMEAA